MALSSPFFCDNCGAANRLQAQFCRACGCALHTVPVTDTNTTIQTTLTGLLAAQTRLKGRYMVLSQSGRGGFGAVYKALDEQHGQRVVAVKEMSQSSLSSQEMVEATAAFKHEAELLEGLSHPNLPAIYDQFTENGRSYLVMDFIEGETLEVMLEKLNGAMLPIDKVLDIALQLCSVLDYLHHQQPPIIFRDLKPGNIMLTPTGQVYLIDFGIARHFKPGQEKDTTALGSYGYAPPEQYGKSQTTIRSDIYSLGATLHQLLSGEDPSETPFQFSPLKLSEPALADLVPLVMSMVRVDINKRPASIADVRRELQLITSRYTQGSTLPRMDARKATTQPAPVAVTMPPLPTNTGSSVRDTTTGKKKVATKKRVGASQIYPQANMLYVCTGHTNRITMVAWSPDGKYLASASYDKCVQIWDGATGKNLATYKGHQGRVNALAWSPDSQMLASCSDDCTVRIWHALSTRTEYIFQQHSAQVMSVSWSPDGKYIVSGGEDASALVWDALSEQHEVFFTYKEHTAGLLVVMWSPDGKYVASAGKDSVVKIWEPQKLAQKRNWLSNLFFPSQGQQHWNGHHGKVVALAWSPDSRYLASVCNDHYVRIRDLNSGHLTTSLGMGSSTLKNTIAWSPAGQHLAIGGNDKLVRLWNIAAKKETYIYHGHVGYVISVSWSPDGSRIASAGVDRTIQVWQTR